ncbi:YtpR family tRNA-binding protein [Sporosarcina sp. G11-34]|uniref:YtpR family tRNA-binding protein n=1 Tax=Sporosarcina sp. G11-34 TaxID=2849605 RepID=UPI0022A9B168|nr:DUF4479 domain-containing tRNA-binding protein [Sporosarcina sp. G11-34]MCZ2259706.1 DUF4479 domain-containing protein [Sporosarcina sp. G11-34]
MNIFYNENGVGEVLLVQIALTKPETVAVETKGDVALVQNEETKEVVAFNMFNASSYVELVDNGEVKLTEELVDQIQKALVKNNVELELDADFTPKFVVGHVLSIEGHPNADRLNVCSIDVGNETLQIVCGASNIAAGQKVVVAKVGAVMPSGMVIRDAELRGVASSGMVCSATELSLPDAVENTGILVLDDKFVVGESFVK